MSFGIPSNHAYELLIWVDLAILCRNKGAVGLFCQRS